MQLHRGGGNGVRWGSVRTRGGSSGLLYAWARPMGVHERRLEGGARELKSGARRPRRTGPHRWGSRWGVRPGRRQTATHGFEHAPRGICSGGART
jgi:hypothetical protein